MVDVSLLLDNVPGPVPPLAWRLAIWTGLTVQTVLSAHGTESRIVAGVLMAVAVVALQTLGTGPVGYRRAALVVVSAAALTACFFARGGTAEIAVFVAASRIPELFDGAALHWFTAADAIAVGVTIAIISDTWPLVLVGVGVPLLVQRSIEHRELVRERDRAQALLAEVQAGREAETQAAALRERGRIAREMHDVLAHSLAGLSMQLQAVRAVAARERVGAAVLDPIDKAAALAKDGLAEARAAVGTLRDPIGLGIDALPALVERHPGTAALTVVGTPAAVAPEAGHAVYRAVQEALTNAARYAPGSAVTVTQRWGPESLEVAVADSGPAPDREVVRGQGTGLGLAGMAERIQQAGGSVQAGPAPDGPGWRVTLTVPLSRDFDLPAHADGAVQRASGGQSGGDVT